MAEPVENSCRDCRCTCLSSLAASTPIIHRDVKSTKILLDDNYIAKVSDFGASGLVPLDQTQLTTFVQRTLGYLDPEYLQTGQLSEKSDIYSFRIVLVELLTGKMPISADRSEDERNLAMHFILSMKNNHLFEVLEDSVVNEGGVEQLQAVAELAKRCLRMGGEERPQMMEVAMELEGLRRAENRSWIHQTNEEAGNLLDEQLFDCENDSIIGFDSLNKNMILLSLGTR